MADFVAPFVMTNTGCLSGSANGEGKGNVSHFKPFSEFLDRYIFDQELSQTPFARIVSIFDRATGENLCAKVIYKRFCSPTGLLVLDPQVLTSIRHKNIIKYYDIYESEEEIIVTIERAFGGELLERIIEKIHYTEMDASHIIKQVLEAVAYLHSKNIIHRDIKPENILLPIAGNDTYIKLSDFGLSKLIRNDDHSLGNCRPRTFSMVGSDYYTAPEVFRHKGYDYKADVFGVGIVTFTLLCGYNPYCGPSGACFRKEGLLLEDPYWTHISPAAKDFVTWLLQTDPEKRPSAEECLKHHWITVGMREECEKQAPEDVVIDVNQPFRDHMTQSRRLSSYA